MNLMNVPKSIIRVASALALVTALVTIPPILNSNFSEAANLVKMHSDGSTVVYFDTDSYRRSHDIELVRVLVVRQDGFQTWQTYLVDTRNNETCLIDVDGTPIPPKERTWERVVLPNPKMDTE